MGLASGHLQLHSLQADLLHRQRILKHAVAALSTGSIQQAGRGQECLCAASKSALVCVPTAQVGAVRSVCPPVTSCSCETQAAPADGQPTPDRTRSASFSVLQMESASRLRQVDWCTPAVGRRRKQLRPLSPRLGCAELPLSHGTSAGPPVAIAMMQPVPGSLRSVLKPPNSPAMATLVSCSRCVRSSPCSQGQRLLHRSPAGQLLIRLEPCGRRNGGRTCKYWQHVWPGMSCLCCRQPALAQYSVLQGVGDGPLAALGGLAAQTRASASDAVHTLVHGRKGGYRDSAPPSQASGMRVFLAQRLGRA